MQTCTTALMAPHKSEMFCCFFPFSSIQTWVYLFSSILFSCTDLFLHCCQSRQWWGEGAVSLTEHSRKSKPAENTRHQQEVELSCLLDKCFLDLNKARKNKHSVSEKQSVVVWIYKESVGGQDSQVKTFKVLLLFLNSSKTHNKILTL